MILKNEVSYSSKVSKLCNYLIAQLLGTNENQRPNIIEILNSPWVKKIQTGQKILDREIERAESPILINKSFTGQIHQLLNEDDNSWHIDNGISEEEIASKVPEINFSNRHQELFLKSKHFGISNANSSVIKQHNLDEDRNSVINTIKTFTCKLFPMESKNGNSLSF